MLNSLMLSVEKTPVNLERYEIVADSLKQAESFSSHDGAFKLGVSFTGIGTSAQYLNDILMHAKKLRTFYLSFNKFDISSDSVDRLSTLNLKAIIETIESNSKVSEDWSHDEVLEVYEARKEASKEVFQLLKSSGVKAGAKINISNILESDHANKNDYVKDFKFRYANRNKLIQEHGFSEDQSQFKSQLAELEEKGSYLEKIQNVLGNSNEVKIDEFVKLNVLEDYDSFINFRPSLEDFLGKYWTLLFRIIS